VGAVRRLAMLTVTAITVAGLALAAGIGLRLFIWAAGI